MINGNPNALNKDVRSIDADLNRVWEKDGDREGIEYDRQKELAPIILRKNVCLLDLHTSSSTHEPFIILSGPQSKETKQLITYLQIQYISYNWEIPGVLGKKLISTRLFAEYPKSTIVTAEAGNHTNQETLVLTRTIVDIFLKMYSKKYQNKLEITKNQLWLKMIKRIILKGKEWKWVKDETGPMPMTKGEILGHMDGKSYIAPLTGYILLPNKNYSEMNPDIGFIAIRNNKDNNKK